MRNYIQKVLDTTHFINENAADIIARIIDVCSRAEKNAEAEYVAKQTIAACSQMIEQPPQDMPKPTGATPQEVAADKASILAMQLSPIRLKYAELLLKQNRWLEAEQELNSTQEYGSPLTSSTLFERNLDLAQALQGQRKTTELIALYKDCLNRAVYTLPLFKHMSTFIQTKPVLTDSQQTDIVASVGRAAGDNNYRTMSVDLKSILRVAETEHWTPANIKLLQAIDIDCDQRHGRNVEAKQANLEAARFTEEINSLFLALKAGHLEGLRDHSTYAKEEYYLRYSDLFNAKKFDTLEDLLKLSIMQLETNPQSWDKNALFEKCLLLKFYLNRNRLEDAAALQRQILLVMNRDPAPFVRGQTVGAHRSN